jgi:hypothetical protein
MKKSLPFLLITACLLSSCAMSKTARNQRAYEKYVRKSSIVRYKQRSMFRHTDKPQMPTMPMPSEPMENTETGPQSVSTGEASAAGEGGS